jgi:hypothetical protein
VRVLLLILLLVFVPIAASAGAWTQPRGAAWIKVAGLYQSADEYYADRDAILPDGSSVQPGDRRPYDDNGRSEQFVLWLEGEYGLTERLTLGAQAIWKDLRYEDDFSRSRSYGWGDTWAVARYAILTGRQRLSARSSFKFPTGKFSTEVGEIPIGENQPDLDVGLQWGVSLGRHLSWLGAEASYRFRFEDESREYDPGDEVFVRLEGGWGFTKRVGLKANWISQRGDETSLNFFAPGTDLNRNYDQVELFAMFDTPWVFVELGWSHVIASESWPAAPLWSLSLARLFH